ncbi:MAG: hypothetical protein QOF58_8698, partial [Pseudonocardiales bacterium]|nr:hypothetical protein [Pseudonocardiales bacterium]
FIAPPATPRGHRLPRGVGDPRKPAPARARLTQGQAPDEWRVSAVDDAEARLGRRSLHLVA